MTWRCKPPCRICRFRTKWALGNEERQFDAALLHFLFCDLRGRLQALQSFRLLTANSRTHSGKDNQRPPSRATQKTAELVLPSGTDQACYADAENLAARPVSENDETPLEGPLWEQWRLTPHEGPARRSDGVIKGAEGKAKQERNLIWECIVSKEQGVEQKDRVALGWYSKAPEQGYAQAEVALTTCTTAGRGWPRLSSKHAWFQKHGQPPSKTLQPTAESAEWRFPNTFSGDGAETALCRGIQALLKQQAGAQGYGIRSTTWA